MDYSEAVDTLTKVVVEKKAPRMENLFLTVSSGFFRSTSLSSLGRALGSGGVASLRKLALCWYSLDDENPGGGMWGLAEGLGDGGMPVLEELVLHVGCPGGDGGAELGQVLSMGKIPSLKYMNLGLPATKMLSALCEGLSAGNSPPPSMRMKLVLNVFGGVAVFAALFNLADVIRSGRISFLCQLISKPLDNKESFEECAGALGRALTHPDTNLTFLEEVFFQLSVPEAVAFMERMQVGGGCLPSLRRLHTGIAWLASLITSGKLPSLSELKTTVQLARTDFYVAYALSAIFHSPHAASLREVDVWFDDDDSPNHGIALAKMATICSSLTSPHLTKLQVLRVTRIFEPGGFHSLCAALTNGKLFFFRELTLQKVNLEVGGDVLSSALQAVKLPGLRVFRLISA
uniref:Uncharacterized protein n=1 Tax=Chromera velia CCMP2878 TaxID=1169474 RepID=A0A0G4FG96_9ALVE|eukprot:Cvel_16685.t1-p1 / transcript=Cvel_16685.t1 / gene=Cvel_16685 / organism=Chromera_velia_CCMP2878 / gene_product=hypothetical protein / transcript_product=hypothetical protein / location=Cvel_scaffold1295:31839-33044(+) / protein_length=402 / sequence_SO=supercontig / SO=protein_coding / is_pseudo=false